MRRLSITLATLVIVSVFQAVDVLACKLLKRSSGACCVSRCSQPTGCLPTVCGPAQQVNDQAVEAMEQPDAESADEPEVTLPETPPAPQPEETPPAAEAPPEQPPEKPEAKAEETSPTESEAPVVQPDTSSDSEKPAGAEEAMTDEERMKAFFGEDAKEPDTGEEKPAPAEEAPEPAAEPPAGGKEKSALDDFFSIQTRKSSLSASLADADSFRTWRDISGRYQIEARFVTCFDDGTVRLEKPNGRWVRLPLAQLSRTDQLFTRQVSATETMIAMTSR